MCDPKRENLRDCNRKPPMRFDGFDDEIAIYANSLPTSRETENKKTALMNEDREVKCKEIDGRASSAITEGAVEQKLNPSTLATITSKSGCGNELRVVETKPCVVNLKRLPLAYTPTKVEERTSAKETNLCKRRRYTLEEDAFIVRYIVENDLVNQLTLNIKSHFYRSFNKAIPSRSAASIRARLITLSRQRVSVLLKLGISRKEADRLKRKLKNFNR